MRRPYEVVGYAGKSGKVRAYKLIGTAPDKFNPGKKRAHLKSFDGELDFWVDADKLTDAPPNPRYCDECETWDGHDITCAFG